MVTFINKDSTSSNVARSTPTERRLINEQSREHRGSARLASARTRARQIRQPIESRLPLPPPSSDHNTSGEFTESTACVNTIVGTRRGLPQSNIPLAGTKTTTTSSILLSTCIDTDIIGQPHFTPGGPIDPFQSTLVPFNTTILEVLRFYTTTYYPIHWSNITTALGSNFDATTIPRCTPNTVVLECMENSTRMYCLLADTGCYMKDTTNVDLSLTQLQLLQRGIESLRVEMSSNPAVVNTDIMIDAVHLYLAAMRTDREDATRAHLAGVRAIVKEILRRGVPVTAPNAALLALVDVELSTRMLRGIDWGVLDGPMKKVKVPVEVFDE